MHERSVQVLQQVVCAAEARRMSVWVRFPVAAASVVLAASLAGCGGSSEQPEADPAPAPVLQPVTSRPEPSPPAPVPHVVETYGGDSRLGQILGGYSSGRPSAPAEQPRFSMGEVPLSPESERACFPSEGGKIAICWA